MTERIQDHATPDLSIIVPVFNAANHLPNVINDMLMLEESGLRCELLMVDDGSSDNSAETAKRLAAKHDRVYALRFLSNRGAGHARNLGWTRAKGRYTLFFDADDTMHGDVVCDAVRDLDGAPNINVVICAYRYEREETASYTDMGMIDTRIFANILRGRRVATGTPESLSPLLTFTNYPWNKIIRTAHYKSAGLKYGSTLVNNEILGHWNSILFARNIMVRDAVICTHIVHPKGDNITNNFGTTRLEMFDALEELYDLLESHLDILRRVAHHFWEFSELLMRWARPRLDPLVVPHFEARRTDLMARIDLGDYVRMRTELAPKLADSFADLFVG